MDKYIAYSQNVFGTHTGRLLSVYANSLLEAKREVERQLDRPNRRYLLIEWRIGGCHVRKA